jgi:hypothetical protein
MLKSKCAGIAGKELLQLQFEFNGQKHIVFTNSTVLIRQVTEYAENMPYYATVRKKGSYYTFT